MVTALNVVVVPLDQVPFEDVEDEGAAPPVVLVVDDEPNVADTLALILSRAGFAARGVYSAKAALEVARAIEPSVLLSDVHMPGMDGVELAITLSKQCPRCEILLFSGHATAADLVEARAAGYDFPLLAKPMHPAEIVRQISKCLRTAKNAVTQQDHSRVQAMRLTSSSMLAS